MKSASPSAFYDSGANPSLNHVPGALQYTHIALDWISNQKSTSMMWLSGESRVLTTSIAQTMAEVCDSGPRKRLLTTFFFSKSDPSRNSAKHFVTSLAYGIIQSVPSSRAAIAHAVEKDPLVISGSIEMQFDKLILQPLIQLNLANQSSTLPYVIIIHALDECEDASARIQILRILERFDTARLSSHKRLLWKIVVMSTPDRAISEAVGSLRSVISCIVQPGPRDEHDLWGGQKLSPTHGLLALSMPKFLPSILQFRPPRLLSIGECAKPRHSHFL